MLRDIAARTRPLAEVVVFDEGDHSQLSRADPRQYRNVITEFLRRSLANRNEPDTK